MLKSEEVMVEIEDEQRKFKEDRKQKYLARLQERREEIDAKKKQHAEETR